MPPNVDSIHDKSAKIKSVEKSDGSQAVGFSGRRPIYQGRIVTGIFSRCDGLRAPVNPELLRKKRKKYDGLAFPA